MSGPKVINVQAVRAAQERAWNKLRHQIEQALKQWETNADRVPAAVSDGTREALFSVLRKLDSEHEETTLPRLLDGVLSDAEAQLSFIKEQSRLLRERSVAAVASSLQRKQALRVAVHDVAQRLSATGCTEASDRLVGRGDEAALEEALALLATKESGQVNDRLQTAVADFGEIASAGSVNDWIKRQAVHADPSFVRLERLAAELAVTEGIDSTEHWLSKLDALRSVSNERDRRLRTDSLVMELTENLAAACREERRQAALADIEAELAAFENVPSALRERFEQLRADKTGNASNFQSEVATWCEAEAKRLDRARSREVILKSLRAMGYDVREGMATLWAEQGHLIVRQPGSMEYGVELSTVSDDRMKTQLVRFSDQSETSEAQRKRDTEMEGKWCGAHESVLRELAANGLGAKILAARAVGTTPVAVMPAPLSSLYDRATGIDKPRQRTLPDPKS